MAAIGNELDKQLEKILGDMPDILYHYTSLDTLCALMKDDASIWCTLYTALNDDAEVRLGQRIFSFYRHCKYEPDRRYNPMSFIEDRQILTGIFSMTKEKDSLGQWRSYTHRQEGGVAIGFDAKRLKDLVEKRKDSAINNANGSISDLKSLVTLMPCLYLRRDSGRPLNSQNQIRRLIDGRSRMLLDFLNGPYTTTMQKVYPGASEDEIIRTTRLLYSAMVKDKSFSSEEEYRIVIQADPEKIDKKLLDIVGGKPRIKFDAFKHDNPVRNCIKEVVISPHGPSKDLLNTVKFLRIKYNVSFEISESKSTYNGR